MSTGGAGMARISFMNPEKRVFCSTSSYHTFHVTRFRLLLGSVTVRAGTSGRTGCQFESAGDGGWESLETDS